MPTIGQVQAMALSEGFLDGIGDNPNSFAPVKLSVTEKVLAQYGAEFKLKLAQLMAQKKVTGSGALEDSIEPNIINTSKDTTLQIKMLGYFDFPNEGVRGVRSSRNAPGSPYSFKNLGVGGDMLNSLKKYIQSGKAKVSSVRSDKAYGIGLESKGKSFNQQGKRSLIDRQAYTMGFLIKAFGIKQTKYFTKAFEETFKDFEPVMAEAVGSDIIITLSQIKLNGDTK
jgi:hypothetical protein